MREQIYCNYCKRKLHREPGGRTGTHVDPYGKVHLVCAKRIILKRHDLQKEE